MLAATGTLSCCMQGRRLPWFIAEGKQELLDSVTSVTSEALSDMIAKMDAEKRTDLVACSEQLRIDITETLQEEFIFFDHLPFLPLGALNYTNAIQRGGAVRFLGASVA